MSYTLLHLCKVSDNHKMYRIQTNQNGEDNLETTMSQNLTSENPLDRSRKEARKKLHVHYTRGDDKTLRQKNSASVSF